MEWPATLHSVKPIEIATNLLYFTLVHGRHHIVTIFRYVAGNRETQ